MQSVVVLLGPTASGKTRLSILLAGEFNGEIISADSMQIYRYMDIGTAKPCIEERAGIKHHLIDEVNPDEEFSVANFQYLALKYIEELISKKKLPIVAGGTGLYINSLVYNINFTETISDWQLREKLQKEAEEKGNAFLFEKLKEIDPESTERIHINDTKRIIRAIEVFEHTKKPISYHQKMSRLNPPKYRFIIIGLTMNREDLYKRIDKRVDLMVERGLVDEVRRLIELGYDRNAIAMQGLGYKEMLSYLRGEISLDDAIYIIKRETRHYAKRQMTWFRRIENVFWVNLDEYDSEQALLEAVACHIRSSMCPDSARRS